MSETTEQYEQLVDEEEELIAKIRLCEECQWTVLELVGRHGEKGREIGEEIMKTVLTIEQDLRTELIHLRLEKGMLAERLRQAFGSAAAFIPSRGKSSASVEEEVE
jgi:hypothetical protein